MKYLLFLLAFTVLFACAQEKEGENAETAAAKNPIVVIKTNHGDITLELFKDAAPETVKNFIDLAEGNKEFTDTSGTKVKKPFYDGLIFHRVVKDFMIQGGCPKGDGTGDGGYKFKDEISAKALGLDKEKVIDKQGMPNSKLRIYRQEQIRGIVLEPIYKKLGINSQETYKAKEAEFKKELKALDIETVYKNMGYKYQDELKSKHMEKGYIAMANSGPNTNGTQFFINLSENKYLDGKHTVFGKVTSGMDIVGKIGAVEVQGSKPVETVYIESVRLKKD